MKSSFVLPLACAALIAPAFAQTGSFEQGVLLNAASLLPAESLRGPSHRVRDQVPTDGFMAFFTMDSDFGTFEAVGVPQARRRVVEIEAIRTLVETSRGDLFAEGLKRSVEQPIAAVRNIVTNPVETVRSAPGTVVRFFGKVGSAVGRGAERIADQASSDGPPPTAGEVGRGIGNVAKNVAGFERAKLETARQLGVDPYSDNPRLQEEMDKVTWAFFAGGLPLRVGAAAVSAGVALAATNLIGLPAETYSLTESELAARDGRSLAAMGVTAEDIRAFQTHGPLSASRRHLIVVALEALPKAAGRGRIIQQANAAATPGEADFLIGALSILAERQRTGAAEYTALAVLGRLPGATNAKGELEVPAPVDHVTWTEQVAGFANRDDLGAAPKLLVHTGNLSQAATAGFMAAGWKPVRVAYPAR